MLKCLAKHVHALKILTIPDSQANTDLEVDHT